jgi:hypothetical protein
MGKYYKTFYVRNLRINEEARVSVPGKLFKPIKHCSLLQKLINYGQNSFITLVPSGPNVIKKFCPKFTNFHNKLEYLYWQALPAWSYICG